MATKTQRTHPSPRAQQRAVKLARLAATQSATPVPAPGEATRTDDTALSDDAQPQEQDHGDQPHD